MSAPEPAIGDAEPTAAAAVQRAIAPFLRSDGRLEARTVVTNLRNFGWVLVPVDDSEEGR